MKTVLKKEKRDGGTWDGWSRLFSIHRDRPTCLEIGALYKNTNLCPGGVRSCEAFVADLVIMFSVLPIQTVFFFSPSEGEECTAYTIILLCSVHKWITPSVREGINVSALKGGYFSPFLFLDGTQRLLAQVWRLLIFLKHVTSPRSSGYNLIHVLILKTSLIWH